MKTVTVAQLRNVMKTVTVAQLRNVMKTVTVACRTLQLLLATRE